MQPKTPAVIVGGNLNGLGVARSLARGRIPAYVLGRNRDCPSAWSRHVTFVPTRSLQDEALISALLDLAKRLKCRPVMILTQDASVLTVSANRERLLPAYHIELPEEPVVKMLSDKVAFDALAAREGFSVPRSCHLRSSTDLPRINELYPPLVLKPANKASVHADGADRAVRADTLKHAHMLAQQMLAHSSTVIAQEWIEGPDSEIFFTFFCTRKDGSPARFFSGRKLQSEPPGVGSTAICIPAPEFAQQLEQETQEFLHRIRYRGLGSLEFKRDTRTKQFLMVEPTVGRTDWQEEIATLSGVNLPEVAYWLALGHEPPESPAQKPQTCAWRSSYEFRLPPTFNSDTRVIDAHFRWSDPLPGVYHYGYKRGLHRAWRRVRGILNSNVKQHGRPL